MSLLQELAVEKVIAIIRGVPSQAMDETGQALVDGGIRFIEVTMNTDGALETISRWRSRFSAPVRIGVGTVLSVDMAKQAIAAGAEYVITPNLDEEVVDYVRSRGLDIWPGTTTPTEIVRACRAGATAVKVFPSGALGLSYFKDIRGPLDHIPMIATGGISIENVSSFLQAGALAVGISGNLVSKALVERGDFDAIRSLAERYTSLAGSRPGAL